MLFKILSAEIKEIPVGKTNAGDKYVQVEIIEDSMFAEKAHKRNFFVPQQQIPAWEKCIADGKFAPYLAKYVIVEGLPLYRAKKSDGTLLPTVHSNMRILVRIDTDGSVIEDANSSAMTIIEQMMHKVDVSKVAPTPIPDAAAETIPGAAVV
jgi:hypothetical protein